MKYLLLALSFIITATVADAESAYSARVSKHQAINNNTKIEALGAIIKAQGIIIRNLKDDMTNVKNCGDVNKVYAPTNDDRDMANCLTIIAATGPVSSTVVNLANGSHTSVDCTTDGGVLIDSNSDGQPDFCKFTADSCPSSWNQYDKWRTTTPKVAETVVNGAFSCSLDASNNCSANQDQDYTSCTTGSHAWANEDVEACFYSYTAGCNSSCAQLDAMVMQSANIIEVGCY